MEESDNTGNDGSGRRGRGNGSVLKGDCKNNVNKLKSTDLSKLNRLCTSVDILTNKLSELDFIVKNENSPLHVIGIQEVKPKLIGKRLTSNEFAMDDYDMFQSNIDNGKGRGVLLYLHKMLKATPIKLDTDFEEIVCAVVNLRNEDKILFGCMYRSLSSTKENNTALRHLEQKIQPHTPDGRLQLRGY